MNFSINNIFGARNALTPMGGQDGENPFQMSRNSDLIQARLERAREQRAAESRLLEEQADLAGSLDLADLTHTLVSGDMALSRIAETAATRASLESRIATEGSSSELEDALTRTTATLAAQIGEAIANADSQPTNGVSQRNNSENGEDEHSNSSANRQLAAVYAKQPPSGLIFNATA
ncbi:MAG: hypothetical protein FWG65_05585 [Turicibacter sp.]|nr:hypothetical protein [Turicibacter sp.]